MGGSSSQTGEPVPTDWSVVRVHGADAVSFLHNLCTNDVKRLAGGESCEALFCNVKGKVLAHTVLCRDAEGVDIVVTSPLAPSLAEHLDRYHIREALTLDTPAAGVALALSHSDGQGFPLAAFGHGARLVIEEPGAPAAKAPDDDGPAAETRIASRFPLDAIDVDARNLPQELNRDADLISFTKGCYLGQETVARIDALGRVNQLLVRLRAEPGALTTGDELTAEGESAGRVTSVASAAGTALAYVRRTHADAGAALTTTAGAAATVER
ncbi:MAG: hypothetical protein AAGB00_04660 [Planctomycetota bacterium]